jgi:hypothetical protein
LEICFPWEIKAIESGAITKNEPETLSCVEKLQKNSYNLSRFAQSHLIRKNGIAPAVPAIPQPIVALNLGIPKCLPRFVVYRPILLTNLSDFGLRQRVAILIGLESSITTVGTSSCFSQVASSWPSNLHFTQSFRFQKI